MTIHFLLSTIEQHVLALWACKQSIKRSAKYLYLTPSQVLYYRCVLRKKLGGESLEAMGDYITTLDDYDAWTLMGQNLMLVYENARIQRRFAEIG